MIKETNEVAYILKRFLPSQQKLSILTRSQGKCNLVVPKESLCVRLWPGMLISFYPHRLNHTTMNSDDIKILYTPEGTSSKDMYWLHHLLELIYYFIPQAYPSHDVFDALSCYLSILDYKGIVQENLILLQKICVMHFLQTTGSASQNFGFYDQDFLAQITSLPIMLAKNKETKTINKILDSINAHENKTINSWILKNLTTHPCFKSFKTIRFMYPS